MQNLGSFSGIARLQPWQNDPISTHFSGGKILALMLESNSEEANETGAKGWREGWEGMGCLIYCRRKRGKRWHYPFLCVGLSAKSRIHFGREETTISIIGIGQMDLTQHSKEYIRMISVLGNRPLSFNRFWAMAAMGVAWCLGGAMPALLKGFVGQKLILLFMIETPV